jgi:hypothetical protein
MVSRRRTLSAVLAITSLLGVGVGVALAGSSAGTDNDERALQDSCRSYAASPSSASAQECAEALRSGAPNITAYGPGSTSR